MPRNVSFLGKTYNFPDDATDEQIQAALLMEPPPTVQETMTGGAPGRYLTGAATSLGEQVTGIGQILNRMAPPILAPEGTKIPQEWGKNVYSILTGMTTDPMKALWKLADEAEKQGAESEAFKLRVLGSVPLVGPMAAHYRSLWKNELAKPEGERDVAGLLGKMTGDLAPWLLTRGAGAAKPGLRPPTTAAPLAIETGEGFFPHLARITSSTPIGMGPATRAVRARQPFVAAEVERVPSVIAPPLPPGAPGSMASVTGQAIAMENRIPTITRMVPSEVGPTTVGALRGAFKAEREPLSASWQAFENNVLAEGIIPDMNIVKEAAVNLYKIPEEARKVATADLSPSTMKLLEKLSTSKEGDLLESLFGKQGATTAERTRLEAALKEAGVVEEGATSWQAVRQAKTAIGGQWASASTKEALGSHNTAVLSEVLNKLDAALTRNLPKELQDQYGSLKTAERQLHLKYGTPIPSKAMQYRPEQGLYQGIRPTDLVDEVLKSSIEDVTQLYKTLPAESARELQQAVLNRIFESKPSLEAAYKELVGSNKSYYQKILPPDLFKETISTTKHRLQSNLYLDCLRESDVGGVYNGSKLAQALVKNKGKFNELGIEPAKAAEIGRIVEKFQKHTLPSILKMDPGHGSKIHSYFQMTAILSGIVGTLSGGYLGQSFLTMAGAGMLSIPLVERAIVKILLHPEGTSLLRRLLNSVTPSESMARAAQKLSVIALASTMEERAGEVSLPQVPELEGVRRYPTAEVPPEQSPSPSP